MKTTISTLTAFSVLGLATEWPTEAPSLLRELAARNCDRSQYLGEWEAGIKAP